MSIYFLNCYHFSHSMEGPATVKFFLTHLLVEAEGTRGRKIFDGYRLIVLRDFSID